jgi:hypothetical protein
LIIKQKVIIASDIFIGLLSSTTFSDHGNTSSVAVIATCPSNPSWSA